jgi:uncharacterized protein
MSWLISRLRLRIHTTQEWHDLYQPHNNDELQRFFDRYTKGIENDWETTPKVRVSLLGYNIVSCQSRCRNQVKLMQAQPNIINHPVKDWPVPETEYKTLYLGLQEQLFEASPTEASTVGYRSDIQAIQADDDPEELYFRFKFSEKAQLLGSVKVCLYVSCKEADDMDLFFQIRKQDEAGNVLRYHNVPEKDLVANGLERKDTPMLNTMIYLGPNGQIRASHRKIDEELSTPHWIRHAHLVEEKVEPGTVAKVETSIWPGGIVFEKGESLVLKVAGHPMYLAEFLSMRGQFKVKNTGMHEVHIGGAQASHVVIPFVDL